MNNLNLKVLVVDDEKVVRLNFVAYLKDDCFDVVTAGSGEEAIEFLERECVDFGIIDMRLPDIDGNELIIKAHKLCPKMKFLIYTGSTEYTIPESLRGIGVGNNHVFIKPVIDMGLFVKAIRSFEEKNV